MKKILSIIVPFYNVENYIGACVDSILAQSVQDDSYEVIFINDGSQDNSDSLLRSKIDFAASPRFQIFKKANGGLSDARNYGVAHSEGQYIWFVDSDDTIEPNSVKVIYDTIDGDDVDIIFHSSYYIDEPDRISVCRMFYRDGVITGPELLRGRVKVCAQFYIVNRSFGNEGAYKFHVGILHEDAELTPRMAYNALNIKILPPPYTTTSSAKALS